MRLKRSRGGRFALCFGIQDRPKTPFPFFGKRCPPPPSTHTACTRPAPALFTPQTDNPHRSAIHGHLSVTRLRVNGLRAADAASPFGAASSDPYVRVTYRAGADTVVVRTKAQRRTLNAEWLNPFRFPIRASGRRVKVEVWDHDHLTDDDPLGEYEWPLPEAFTGPEGAEVQAPLATPRHCRQKCTGHIWMHYHYTASPVLGAALGPALGALKPCGDGAECPTPE